MRSFDFECLYEVFDNWPHAPIPEQSDDSVFDRIRQILAGYRGSGELTRFADISVLLRHVLRRHTLQSNSIARLRVPAGDLWGRIGTGGCNLVSVRRTLMTPSTLSTQPHGLPTGWKMRTNQYSRMPSQKKISERIGTDRSIRFWGKHAGSPTTYLPGSAKQCEACSFCLREKTLIVALPTGSGKSLLAQAPVLVRGLEGALTICVVPTTRVGIGPGTPNVGGVENQKSA